jgi:hypothetical protein
LIKNIGSSRILAAKSIELGPARRQIVQQLHPDAATRPPVVYETE